MIIGNIKLDNNVVLAPMAGINNKAFREIAREFGAGLVTTEMISDNAILQKNEHTKKMLEVSEKERPISMQIFGSEKESLVEAAKIVDGNSLVDIIDINMGCPVPKVTKNGGGAKWLLNTTKIEETIKEIVKVVNKPVTVKMRIGWDENNINAIDNAKAIECAGAKAVAVHGRTKEQMYSGKADWDIIGKVKNNVSIPVIGNGDIFSPQDARRMIDQTNVDGVMIGRAALGNPWILSRTIRYLSTGDLLPEPTPREKLNIVLLHMERLIDIKGEVLGIKEMRKHASWYLKGLPQAARIRDIINKIEKKNEMQRILINYIETIEMNVTMV